MARPSGRNVRSEVLDEATLLIRTRGVTGFSVGDVADRVGVRAPSIHHHFARKDDLIAETISRYRQTFRADVDRIEATDPLDRLRRFADLFLRAVDDDVLCLCGAAIAAWDDLSEPGRLQTSGFFGDQLAWVESEVTTGVEQGRLLPHVDARRFAATYIAALEGALLLARSGVHGGAARSVPDTLLEGVIA
ncbi:MAG: TetR/AcrR family transcriptional regulator [Actinomycetota bacterium]